MKVDFLYSVLTDTSDTGTGIAGFNWNILIEYAVYIFIIVIGLLVLALIKRKSRLPSHTELRDLMGKLGEKLRTLIAYCESSSKPAEGQNGGSKVEKLTKLLYDSDKLYYQLSLSAEKEKDVDLQTDAQYIGEARKLLQSYKIIKPDKEDLKKLNQALESINLSMRCMDNILERDVDLKKQKQKG